MPEKTRLTLREMPEQIRISLGTAIVLGLSEGKLEAQPTTAYLMTYKIGKCTANCGFCPQARDSKSNTELLSRVSWPTFPTSNVLTALIKGAKEAKIKRVCIQALNYPEVFVYLEGVVKQIKKHTTLPVSVSCQPLNKKNIQLLAQAGVDRLGIAIDAATESIFDKVKGASVGSGYNWDKQFNQLNEAVRIFGKGNVSTHLIVGLGETEKEAINVMQRCINMSILPALFAFTPIRGSALENNSPPKIEAYRRVQIARYLIVSGKSGYDKMKFDAYGKITDFGLNYEALIALIESGLPFLTSGCPDCNRPFYNEKVSGPIYNYPKQPNQKEIEEIKKILL